MGWYRSRRTGWEKSEFDPDRWILVHPFILLTARTSFINKGIRASLGKFHYLFNNSFLCLAKMDWGISLRGTRNRSWITSESLKCVIITTAYTHQRISVGVHDHSMACTDLQIPMWTNRSRYFRVKTHDNIDQLNMWLTCLEEHYTHTQHLSFHQINNSKYMK